MTTYYKLPNKTNITLTKLFRVSKKFTFFVIIRLNGNRF